MEELQLSFDKQKDKKHPNNSVSGYTPNDEARKKLSLVKIHFQLGYVNMYYPRVELNDLAIIQRAMVDQMAFNTYQPNDGVTEDWHSNAIRPIVRNQVIAAAAHATARTPYPKWFAWNNQNEEQEDAAEAMSSLIEVAGQQANYKMVLLMSAISALVNPITYIYKEYAEIFQTSKRGKNADGSWYRPTEIDLTRSGHKAMVVSPDEVFFQNFFEPDHQKDSWMIWRRVVPHETIMQVFKDNPNLVHVKPGIIVLYNDPNATFYEVYDPNMRPYMDEWVREWDKEADTMVDIVNGILMSEPDAPNPRQDKLFPFATIGYEPINNRCRAKKSLAFKLQNEARVANTLLPMFVDSTYLDTMPPYVIAGEINVPSNIIVPGRGTALPNPQATFNPLLTNRNTGASLSALQEYEKYLVQSSGVLPVQSENPGATATEIAEQKAQQNTLLGIWIQMIGDFVRQYGELTKGDILQYDTIGEVKEELGDLQLVYKTFFSQPVKGKQGGKKLVFDPDMPLEPSSPEIVQQESLKTLKKQGYKDGEASKSTLMRINPEVFRKLNFWGSISDDVMNPMSEELEYLFAQEVWQKAVTAPPQMPAGLNQESMWELLFSTSPATKRNPKKFMQDQNAQGPLAALGQPQQPDQKSTMLPNGAPSSMRIQNPPQPVPKPGTIPQFAQQLK